MARQSLPACMAIGMFLLGVGTLFAAPAAPRGNLLRNGSSEGSLLYWHDQKGKSIADTGKVGRHAMQLDKGWTLSAPIALEKGEEYTISLWARTTAGDGSINVGLCPMAREVAQQAHRIWSKGATKGANLGPAWERLHFTWRADVATTGFWPQPKYGVYISKSDSGASLLVDGVTLVHGNQGTPDYLPYRRVEVVAEATNLPGWEGDRGNIYEKGATATLAGHVWNPGTAPSRVSVRWQLLDYEGEQAWSDPVDRELVLGPGETQAVPVQLPLTATGTVIARVSVLGEDSTVIDSSDMPLTSLPYPMHATKIDSRERFGGSFAGDASCLAKLQRIGFGWTRWWPRGKWHDFEPEQGQFNWRDKDFEEAFSRGISCHIVLYGNPKWAMDKSSPLPKDMRWKGDDPRWEDYGIETSWDRYVKAAVEHFRGKPVVFQIANEPGHEKGWHAIKDAYVKFNLRTAHLIKMTDPKAKVSLNNVYTNPSPPNAALLSTKQLQDFDIWSWHDYRAGWLLDARGVKRIRQMLDEAGGTHMEIWFTEGWMYTNTLVDQPTACTQLTSVESTHAVADSIAEMSASGHDKVVMFHLLYGTHGQSFWDYSGPGVMLWDWYGYPLPTLAAWNSLNHHIGISTAVGLVQPKGANFAIFQDDRNERGVMIAYADRDATQDAVVDLPIAGLEAEDIMGNPVAIPGDRLVLRKTGRPVVLYSPNHLPGKAMYDALEPLDRTHLGFVERVNGTETYRLPDRWDGSTTGSVEGNPVANGGRPVWRIDRLYPNDRIMPRNYTPMVWGNQVWTAPDHTHGGHPSASVQNGSIRFGTMGPWNGEMDFKKQGALSFIVPGDGVYRVQTVARSKPWGGSKGVAKLYVMKRDEQRVGLVKSFDLPPTNEPVDVNVEVDAGVGHEIVLLVEMAPHNNSTNITLNKVTITRQ